MAPRAKSIRLAILAGIVAIVAACAPASGPQSGASVSNAAPVAVFDAPKASPEGYQVFQIGDVRAPLPEGRWKLVGEVDLSTGSRYPAIGYVLASETAGAIDRVVTIWWQRTFGGRFRDFENCSAKSNLASDVKSQRATSTDCVYVRAVAWPDNGRMGPLLRRYASANGLYAPLVTVGPRVALSLSSTERIAIDYGFSVDLIAPPPARGYWTPEDWTPTAATDGTRRAVVEAMRGFGAKMRPQVARAYVGTS